MKTTKLGADTALARTVKLVQEAQNSKDPDQQLADRAAFWLALVALIGGMGTLLAGRFLGAAIGFAITVVVITRP